MKAPKYFYLICFVLCSAASFFVMYYLSEKNENTSFLRGKISTASINKIEPVIRGSGIWLHYTFQVDGQLCSSKSILYVDSKKIESVKLILQSRSIPILYDPKSYCDNNKLILDLPNAQVLKLNVSKDLNHIFEQLDQLK